MGAIAAHYILSCFAHAQPTAFTKTHSPVTGSIFTYSCGQVSERSNARISTKENVSPTDNDEACAVCRDRCSGTVPRVGRLRI